VAGENGLLGENNLEGLADMGAILNKKLFSKRQFFGIIFSCLIVILLIFGMELRFSLRLLIIVSRDCVTTSMA
jgi:hypothetical protein